MSSANMSEVSTMMGEIARPDPVLTNKIVTHLKSQGIFDNFRRECMADVDTKPAYQNLRQRVEGTVSAFLKMNPWTPDMNKNQLRDNLRKHIQSGGFLDTGVDRIVDQVVNPKIYSVFMPKVEEVVQSCIKMDVDAKPIFVPPVNPEPVEPPKPQNKHNLAHRAGIPAHLSGPNRESLKPFGLGRSEDSDLMDTAVEKKSQLSSPDSEDFIIDRNYIGDEDKPEENADEEEEDDEESPPFERNSENERMILGVHSDSDTPSEESQVVTTIVDDHLEERMDNDMVAVESNNIDFVDKAEGSVGESKNKVESETKEAESGKEDVKEDGFTSDEYVPKTPTINMEESDGTLIEFNSISEYKKYQKGIRGDSYDEDEDEAISTQWVGESKEERSSNEEDSDIRRKKSVGNVDEGSNSSVDKESTGDEVKVDKLKCFRGRIFKFEDHEMEYESSSEANLDIETEKSFEGLSIHSRNSDSETVDNTKVSSSGSKEKKSHHHSGGSKDKLKRQDSASSNSSSRDKRDMKRDDKEQSRHREKKKESSSKHGDSKETHYEKEREKDKIRDKSESDKKEREKSDKKESHHRDKSRDHHDREYKKHDDKYYDTKRNDKDKKDNLKHSSSSRHGHKSSDKHKSDKDLKHKESPEKHRTPDQKEKDKSDSRKKHRDHCKSMGKDESRRSTDRDSNGPSGRSYSSGTSRSSSSRTQQETTADLSDRTSSNSDNGVSDCVETVQNNAPDLVNVNEIASPDPENVESGLSDCEPDCPVSESNESTFKNQDHSSNHSWDSGHESDHLKGKPEQDLKVAIVQNEIVVEKKMKEKHSTVEHLDQVKKLTADQTALEVNETAKGNTYKPPTSPVHKSSEISPKKSCSEEKNIEKASLSFELKNSIVTDEAHNNSVTQSNVVKFKKPKIAANIHEVRKIMKEMRKLKQAANNKLENSKTNEAVKGTSMKSTDTDNSSPEKENNDKVKNDSVLFNDLKANSGIANKTFKKPKIAANIYEVKKIMQARRKLKEISRKSDNTKNPNIGTQVKILSHVTSIVQSEQVTLNATPEQSKEDVRNQSAEETKKEVLMPTVHITRLQKDKLDHHSGLKRNNSETIDCKSEAQVALKKRKIEKATKNTPEKSKEAVRNQAIKQDKKDISVSSLDSSSEKEILGDSSPQSGSKPNASEVADSNSVAQVELNKQKIKQVTKKTNPDKTKVALKNKPVEEDKKEVLMPTPNDTTSEKENLGYSSPHSGQKHSASEMADANSVSKVTLKKQKTEQVTKKAKPEKSKEAVKNKAAEEGKKEVLTPPPNNTSSVKENLDKSSLRSGSKRNASEMANCDSGVQVTIKKRKIANNINEVKSIMKARRNLKKIDKQISDSKLVTEVKSEQNSIPVVNEPELSSKSNENIKLSSGNKQSSVSDNDFLGFESFSADKLEQINRYISRLNDDIQKLANFSSVKISNLITSWINLSPDLDDYIENTLKGKVHRKYRVRVPQISDEHYRFDPELKAYILTADLEEFNGRKNISDERPSAVLTVNKQFTDDSPRSPKHRRAQNRLLNGKFAVKGAKIDISASSPENKTDRKLPLISKVKSPQIVNKPKTTIEKVDLKIDSPILGIANQFAVTFNQTYDDILNENETTSVRSTRLSGEAKTCARTVIKITNDEATEQVVMKPMNLANGSEPLVNGGHPPSPEKFLVPLISRISKSKVEEVTRPELKKPEISPCVDAVTEINKSNKISKRTVKNIVEVESRMKSTMPAAMSEQLVNNVVGVSVKAKTQVALRHRVDAHGKETPLAENRIEQKTQREGRQSGSGKRYDNSDLYKPRLQLFSRRRQNMAVSDSNCSPLIGVVKRQAPLTEESTTTRNKL